VNVKYSQGQTQAGLRFTGPEGGQHSSASRAPVHGSGGRAALLPEGYIQKPPTGGREWLKYPKKIKRLLFNKTLDNKSLDIYN